MLSGHLRILMLYCFNSKNGSIDREYTITQTIKNTLCFNSKNGSIDRKKEWIGFCYHRSFNSKNGSIDRTNQNSPSAFPASFNSKNGSIDRIVEFSNLSFHSSFNSKNGSIDSGRIRVERNNALTVSIPKMVRLIVYWSPFSALNIIRFNSKNGSIDSLTGAQMFPIAFKFQFQKWFDW